MAENTRNSSESIGRRALDAIRRSPLARSEFLSNLYRNAVVRWHGSNNAPVGEFTVTFDPRDRFIPAKLIVDGGYEEREISLLCSQIKPGDTVFDIGANIGLYTLHMSRAVGSHGTVVAFEPDPDNFRLLEHNVASNECNNVRLFNCALSDKDGTLDLFQCEENRGMLSFADLTNTGEAVRVDVRRGDSVIDELGLGVPSVVKIDVEGAEWLVMRGLGHEPPIVQMEFVPEQLRANDVAPMEFLRYLESLGYSIDEIDPDTAALDSIAIETFLTKAEATKDDYNLLLTRV